MTSLRWPIQDFKVVGTILGPNIVGYIYHRVLGPGGVFDKYEFVNFVRNRSCSLNGRSIKGIGIILSMTLTSAVLGQFTTGVTDSGLVGWIVAFDIANIRIIGGSLAIAIVVGGHSLKDCRTLKGLLNYALGKVLDYNKWGFWGYRRWNSSVKFGGCSRLSGGCQSGMSNPT